MDNIKNKNILPHPCYTKFRCQNLLEYSSLKHFIFEFILNCSLDNMSEHWRAISSNMPSTTTIKIPINLPPQLPSPPSCSSTPSPLLPLATDGIVYNLCIEEQYYCDPKSSNSLVPHSQTCEALHQMGLEDINLNMPATISLKDLCARCILHANAELGQTLDSYATALCIYFHRLSYQSASDRIRLLLHYFHSMRSLFLALLAMFRWSAFSNELNIATVITWCAC